MKQLLITILLTLAITTQARADELKVTCYCPESCPGEVTASGEYVRDGIAAVGREHFGDCAMIWTLDGQFLGYYECLDIGGTEAIRKGYVIDLWKPDMATCKDIMKVTEGKVIVQWVDNPKG